MNKKLLWGVFKYALAVGLLTYVVWSNWGEDGRVAARVVVGQGETFDAGPPTVVGRVARYVPGASLTVEGEDGGEFLLIDGKSSVRRAGEPEPERPGRLAALGAWLTGKRTVSAPPAVEPGATVAVWEHPGRGLAHVWRRHVVERVPVHYAFLAGAFAAFTMSLLLTLFRWYVLVRAQDLPVRLADAYRLGLVGFFFNTFMPGSVGGDIIKAAFLAREQKDRRTVAVATVIMDRAIALWALVWFVAISGGIFWAGGLLQQGAEAKAQFVIRAAAAIVVVSFLGWVLMGFLPPHRAERFAGRLGRIPKIGHSASEFWRAVWMYRCRQTSVYAAMLVSWLGHVGFVLAFYCSARVLWDAGDAAQKIPTFWEHFLIVPIGLVINAMPLFPGGAGIGELGFGGLYRWFGASAACGVLGSLVQRVLIWVLGFGSYLVYLRMKSGLQTEPEQPAELAVAQT